MTTWWASDGRRDSGSLIGSVSAFGAVAPTSIPSSRPAPDTAMATLGSESLLQASLRITVLMIHSTGPTGPCPARGSSVSTGGVDTCVTWAVPPLRDPARPPAAQISPCHPDIGLATPLPFLGRPRLPVSNELRAAFQGSTRCLPGHDHTFGGSQPQTGRAGGPEAGRCAPGRRGAGQCAPGHRKRAVAHR